MAKSHGEADFWKAQWQKLHDHLGKDLLAELDKLAKAPKVKDTGDYISLDFVKQQGK